MVYGTTLSDLGSDALNLAQVQEAGQFFDKFRIFASAADAAQTARQKTQALYAKAAGKQVIFGYTPNTAGLTLSYFQGQYTTEAIALAQWCETNEIEEFSFANEEELRIDGVTIVDPYALVLKYKTLATTLKAYYNGLLSFCLSNGSETWVSGIQPGDIDRIGFNCYGDYNSNYGRCTYSTLVSRASTLYGYSQWRDLMYISEFNVDFSLTRFTTIAEDDRNLTIEVRRRLDAFKSIGLTEIIPFCWVYAAGSQRFSMKKTNGTYRDFLQVFTREGQRYNLANLN